MRSIGSKPSVRFEGYTFLGSLMIHNDDSGCNLRFVKISETMHFFEGTGRRLVGEVGAEVLYIMKSIVYEST